MKFSSSDYVIEPANIHVIRCVSSVNIANMPRKVVTPPSPDIDNGIFYGVPIEFVENYAMINKQGLTGEMKLQAGWNCGLNTKDNTVVVSAIPGIGASVYEAIPSEVAVTPEEEEILNRNEYLSRGPKCYQLIRSINGLYGPDISVMTGDGIEIDASDGEITINLVESNQKKDCDLPECDSSLLAKDKT